MNMTSQLPAAASNAASEFDWAHLISRNKFKCPNCDSIVYSRKSRFCGVCGSNLPASFLFTQNEGAGVKQLLAAERSKHREWLSRRDDCGWSMRVKEFKGSRAPRVPANSL